ncbi:hypothetical protein LTR53_010444 [Teratosphaeriaceae sp. CCFEE 6253]|nr:hypothetical protein LTR53_010444 [Teratosphaeriaceae sp. CCFEE 6253]
MAPDLNAVAAGERFDYSQPGSTGYNINPDLTYNDASNRKLRVLTIGAGVTGILMAYRIQKDCPNVEHVVYEKNDDVDQGYLASTSLQCLPNASIRDALTRPAPEGWRTGIPEQHATSPLTRTPTTSPLTRTGPASSPTRLTSGSTWTKVKLTSEEVCETFDLRKYMTFSTEVAGCYWDEGKGEWKVKLREMRNVRWSASMVTPAICCFMVPDS